MPRYDAVSMPSTVNMKKTSDFPVQSLATPKQTLPFQRKFHGMDTAFLRYDNDN